MSGHATSEDYPLVSAVMVTCDRVALSRRSLRCLQRQSYPNIELVIVDHGQASYDALLSEFDFPIRYHRVGLAPGQRLGHLRNLSLSFASGAFIAQWDDDEWHHTTRIETQMRALQRHTAHAVFFSDTLMHLSGSPQGPFRTGLDRGTPGTVLHRRCAAAYPNLQRHEDSVFRRRLHAFGKVVILEGQAHQFIRCFHGSNTWHRRHFAERLRRGPKNTAYYVWSKYVLGDLGRHPAFRLNTLEREVSEEFLSESQALGLI